MLAILLSLLATRELVVVAVVVLLQAIGTYLLLPHRHGAAKKRSTHLFGATYCVIGVLLFGVCFKAPPALLTGLFFYVFAFAAVGSGILTVTSTDPIHSALWFASVVLSTSGLFLIAGAQFLAAGTIIVYAGAIIVTFLFVIMLAQMEGRAIYDRAARSPFRATLTSFMLFWALLYSLSLIKPSDLVASSGKAEATAITKLDLRLPSTEHLRSLYARQSKPVVEVLNRASRSTSQLAVDGKIKPHVASLGETLFSDHLVSVELAGTLLFIALVGALVIAAPKRPIRPGDPAATV